ncbi:MAG: cytidine deaminase [Flavobacteriales bacterium]|nr:MAG: cytidine deaminase [Flavobacteriales bacterium]
MQEKEFSTAFIVFNSISELPHDAKSLMEQAINARKKAYAPYSKFMVGAAILLANGRIVTGNNQENAAFPSGMCAERVAIYQAGSRYPNEKILQIAISAANSTNNLTTPIAPCGACRQAIAEYEQKQKTPIYIFFMGETGNIIQVKSLEALLPFGFGGQYLY